MLPADKTLKRAIDLENADFIDWHGSCNYGSDKCVRSEMNNLNQDVTPNLLPELGRSPGGVIRDTASGSSYHFERRRHSV